MKRRRNGNNSFLIAAAWICVVGCAAKNEPKQSVESTKPITQAPKQNTGPPLFKLLDSEQTGVDFFNEIHENWEHNILNYDYMYNGGGVGIGDFNNDGLQDLFFTGNRVSNRVYLNKGNLQFEDVSKSAGIFEEGVWNTGVSVIDINNDGFQDVYVCRSYHQDNANKRKNVLYINDGNTDGSISFTERAEEFGLADPAYSIQAAFFDYDRDGDLDVYLANHFVEFRGAFRERHKDANKYRRDKLYRNDGNTFTNVSKEAGIHNYACGLGLAVGDVNKDGFPDVFVANDYEEPDYYYENNGDGTFTEKSQEVFRHSAMFGMGTALQDINNDGLLDLMELDMVAEDNYRQKTSMASMNIPKFWAMVDFGQGYQYMRNVLQLNNGHVPGIGTGQSFSEVGYLAGIANTDWSWAVLMNDFDNDGLKDLYITNGFRRDSRNKDAIHKVDHFVESHGGKMYKEFADSMLNMFPTQKIENYYYSNQGNLSFEKQIGEAGVDVPSFSNGASAADLDNDGDLDIVVNNLIDPAFIFQNNAVEQERGNFLKVQLDGPNDNIDGLGASITVHTGGTLMFEEMRTVRGYQSSTAPIQHFGLGELGSAELVEVVWPDGKTQQLTNVDANQTITLAYSDAKPLNVKEHTPDPLMMAVASSESLDFTHVENENDDFETEILLPHKMSHFGPALAVGDVNNDGLEDCYLGGAFFEQGAMFLQQNNGNFTIQSGPWTEDYNREDVAASFLDFDGDGDLDLYVVSGGNELPAGSPLLYDRLYENTGNGEFASTNNRIPPIASSGGCVVPGDFDGDGDLDLFVGGRVQPQQYPKPANSFILRNEGGRFSDVTDEIAADLRNSGMLTSAVWVDVNGDGSTDLITVGEWTPITVWLNFENHFTNSTDEFGLQDDVGWWNKIVATDLDADGDLDFVIGNLGLNYKYKASKEEPFQVYADDFDQSGTLDIVLGYFNEGTCFPVRGRQCSSEQMPNIKKKFPTYDAFGKATLNDVYGDKLNSALHLKATNYANSWLENENGNLVLHELPLEAQFSCVRGILAQDFNQDGNEDILICGNFYVSEIETGRADAGIGLLLLGDGSGNFSAASAAESGFFANKDARDMVLVGAGPNEPPFIVVANNNAAVDVFKLQNSLIETEVAAE